MNIEDIRQHALSKPDVTESFPFDEFTLVFKVNEKMFLLLSLDAKPISFNVKCEPERAIELREQYPDTILPGYHMNKQHWNTVIVDGVLSKDELFAHIDRSYELVAAKKTKKRP